MTRTLDRKWSRRLAATMMASSVCCGMASPVLAQVADEEAPTQFYNQATYSYRDPANDTNFSGISAQLETNPEGLVDPLGQILGCDGSLLPNYTGFSVGLYEPDATGLELGNLVRLTGTEFPDIENNGIPGGLEPNGQNVNPFALSNADQGTYNFLFDPTTLLQSPVNAGLTQTDVDAKYILVVNPPADSIYPERRILLEILASTGGVNNSVVRYRATALDGIPLSATGGAQISDTVVEVFNAETEGLNLFSLAFGTVMCEEEQISVTKTADRAAAQPGDTVVYRLLVRNLVNVDLDAVIATDILPAGFQLLPEASFATINDSVVPLNVDTDGTNVTFSTPTPLPAEETMEIIYAARLTPDALRGDGENSVVVNGTRSDNGLNVQDGPSIHRVLIDPGILSDCGTLIGRVFEDKNFDGEQQFGEAGIPNAVVFLEDGNRIVTDADGLFSVHCLLPGHHSGVLDFSSLPGYTLAPNLYFNERNSQSRLVHLAPGGMVRMNFGVTPAFQEDAR
ncbi:MAG: hypothetical protein AAF959_08455 [Cyanobacteria bacterium P01_D01_bin.56]